MSASANALPTSDDAVPAGCHAVSKWRDLLPGDRNQMPAAGDALPSGRDALPAVRNQVPAATDALPGGNNAMPAGAHAMRGGGADGVPRHFHAMPLDHHPVSARRHQLPQRRHDLSHDGHPVPDHADAMPNARDAMRQCTNHLPGGADAMPAAGDGMRAPAAGNDVCHSDLANHKRNRGDFRTGLCGYQRGLPIADGRHCQKLKSIACKKRNGSTQIGTMRGGQINWPPLLF